LLSDWRSVEVFRSGQTAVDIPELVDWLFDAGYRHLLLEGGPTLLRHFIDAGQLDELFLTIAPKILAGSSAETLSLVGGVRYSPKAVRQLELVDHFVCENELYVRYRVRRAER
jgi:riboflavin biosynthesis pyrimidine reductase